LPEIKSIFCFKRGSGFITTNGKVWAAGNFKEEKKERMKQIKEEFQQTEEFSFSKVSKGSKKGSQKQERKQASFKPKVASKKI
jgi:hypothetical protein